MEDRLEGLEVGEVMWSNGNGGRRTQCSALPQGPQDGHTQLVKNPRLETEPRELGQPFNTNSL